MPQMAQCERCGATEQLERHHPDHSAPDCIVVLCRRCHVAEDVRLGKRGLGARAAPERISRLRPSQSRDAERALPALDDGGRAPELVHLVGAPGAGKSTLGRRWCADRQWRLLSIDDLRRSGLSEVDTVAQLTMALLRGPWQPTLVESAGVSAQVHAAVRAAQLQRQVAARAVVLTVDADTMRARVRARGTQPIWGDIEQLLRWGDGVRWRLVRLYPADRAKWVSAEGDAEAVYQRLVLALAR